jgi:hypothetical protein
MRRFRGAAADGVGGLHGELDDVAEIDRGLRLRERAPGGGREHGTRVDRDDLDPVPPGRRGLEQPCVVRSDRRHGAELHFLVVRRDA